MKTRNWGLGILALGAIVAVTAAATGPLPGLVPDTSAYGSDQSPVIPAENAKPGIVAEVLGLLQEPKAVFDARTKVTTECMAAAGFPGFSNGGQGDRLTDMSASLRGFPGLSLERARMNGYRSEDDAVTSPAADPAEELKAYQGFDPIKSGADPDFTKGCRGAGYIAIYGGATADQEFTRVLGTLLPAIHSANRDIGFKNALVEWSKCMSDTGFPALTDPGNAASLSLNFVGADGTDGAGPEARRIAVADVTCRGTTNLIPRLDAVLARYLTTAVEKHGQEFAPARALRKESAARVAALTK